MVPRAFLIPLALVCLALIVPSAQAGLTITVTGPDTGPEVTPGGSTAAVVQVAISTNGNMVCPQAETVTLALRAGLTDEAGGFAGSMTPETLDFEIPQGAWTDNTGHHDADPIEATLTMITDADKVTPGHTSHSLAATATWDGNAIGLCQGDASSTQEVSASHQVNFPIKQVPQDTTATPGTGGGGGGGGNGSDPSTEPTDGDAPEESPAPGVLTIVIVALALAVLRRRQ